ncbi:MAG: AmmeMemoRadiSam system protein B [Spirochaetes bacterium]|nr:AmmeMemoRadiSam system protein B [Spirochaetota bacterium]
MGLGAKLRKAALRGGWYPEGEGELDRLIGGWLPDRVTGKAFAALAPHAGWIFSGRLSALAVASLLPSETIVVIGGHLGSQDPMLCAYEESFETTGGLLAADAELRGALLVELRDSGLPAPLPDVEDDNSVEVLLPLIKALQPEAKVLWLRSPPRLDSKELGAALGRAAAFLGRKVSCIGSSDLTHYGPAYGFTPAGRGMDAEKWVSKTNDKAFVDALLDMNCESALLIARRTGSACSAGAAIAALGFALEAGATEAKLLGYSTSLEVRKAESFVGYAALAFV